MLARFLALRSRSHPEPDHHPAVVSRTLVLVTLAEMLTEAEAARDRVEGDERATALVRAAALREARDRLVEVTVTPTAGRGRN